MADDLKPASGELPEEVADRSRNRRDRAAEPKAQAPLIPPDKENQRRAHAEKLLRIGVLGLLLLIAALGALTDVT